MLFLYEFEGGGRGVIESVSPLTVVCLFMNL